MEGSVSFVAVLRRIGAVFWNSPAVGRLVRWMADFWHKADLAVVLQYVALSGIKRTCRLPSKRAIRNGPAPQKMTYIVIARE